MIHEVSLQHKSKGSGVEDAKWELNIRQIMHNYGAIADLVTYFNHDRQGTRVLHFWLTEDQYRQFMKDHPNLYVAYVAKGIKFLVSRNEES